jgi:hypothetical protein
MIRKASVVLREQYMILEEENQGLEMEVREMRLKEERFN